MTTGAMVAGAVAALGRLDVAVNSAGFGTGEAFLAIDEAVWDRTLDVNLKATACICAAALAPFGVRVNSVAPGMMDTPLQRVTERQLAAIEGRNDVAVFLDERTRRIPIGRRVSPEVVAEAVIWLALDAPDYITAERLNASGGLDRD
jgi:NAD(P)-dependent dehydrogenase (short-subunit alcohol dehydrogenase family)